MGFGNWFGAKYLRLRLLHHPFALRELYIIGLSTCCIKATVCSIRYFDWQKVGLLFDPINW